MANSCDPIRYNKEGLECFAAGDPIAAELLLKKAYRNLATETGFLVNLGLALMQRGRINQAERAYRLALQSNERRVRRSAAKNLGLLLRRITNRAYCRPTFAGRAEANQWRGDPPMAAHSPYGTMWEWGMPSICAIHTAPNPARRKGAFCCSRIANSAISRPSRMAIEVVDGKNTLLAKGAHTF